MPTTVERLEGIRDNLLTVLANETLEWASNGPKPSYSIDGQSVSWTEWLKAMREEIAELEEDILEASQRDDPFEHVERRYT